MSSAAWDIAIIATIIICKLFDAKIKIQAITIDFVKTPC